MPPNVRAVRLKERHHTRVLRQPYRIPLCGTTCGIADFQSAGRPRIECARSWCGLQVWKPAAVRRRRPEDQAVRVRFCAVKNCAVSNRNCVVARRGGAQRNENDPSITPAARRGGRRELDSAGAGVRFGGRGKLPTLVPTPIGSRKMRVKCGLCRRTPRHQHPRSGQGSWARARSARRRSGSAVVATGFSDVVGFHPMVKSEQVSDVA